MDTHSDRPGQRERERERERELRIQRERKKTQRERERERVRAQLCVSLPVAVFLSNVKWFKLISVAGLS